MSSACVATNYTARAMICVGGAVYERGFLCRASLATNVPVCYYAIRMQHSGRTVYGVSVSRPVNYLILILCRRRRC